MVSVKKVHGSLRIFFRSVEIFFIHCFHLRRKPGVDKLGWVKKRCVRKRSVELVETAFGRMILRWVPKMPLANCCSCIAQRLKPIGNRNLFERQSTLTRDCVELMSKPCWILAGH